MNYQITRNRKKIIIFCAFVILVGIMLCVRVGYLMIFRAEHYSSLAKEQQERERPVKAARGMILDVNGNIIATNKTVCTVSVIHNQIEDAETVIKILAAELGMDEAAVRKALKRSVRWRESSLMWIRP